MLVILSKINRHQHGAYLSPTGEGITSADGKDKHTHVITQEPQILDEQGQVVEEGQWFVEAAGDEPHTHEIEELVRTEPKQPKKNEDERVAEFMSLIQETEHNEGDSIEKGRESYGYYFGDGQWDKGRKEELEKNQRAAITINEIESRVDILCGTHDQNKTDVIFRPVEDGDTQTADIANMVYKSVMNQNTFHREEGYVFRDLTVAGRGSKTVELDFDSNVEGDIKIRWFPWDKVRFGPHERPDQEDLEYLIKHDNFSIGKLKQLFPKKNKEIDFSMLRFDNAPEGFSEDTHQNVAGLAYRLNQDNITDFNVAGQPIVDVARKEFRVYELWQKVFRNVKGFVLTADNFVEQGDDIKERDVNLIKRIPGMSVINRKVCDIRRTEMAGGIILSDEILDLPPNANTFHVITGYAKKYKNKFIGKVEPTKGVQQSVNKLASQTIDITNKMAAYGWFYDNETFENPTDGEQFRRTSSQAGFNQKVKDVARPPLQVQGVKFPSELVNLKAVASQDLDAIMGVPPKAADFSGDITAKLHLLTKRQSLVGNDFLFENSNMANQRLAKLVIAYIQELYTPQRIMRILGSQTEEDLAELDNPENVVNVTIEEIEAMLANESLLKLDLVMSESAHTDTMKELTFMSIQETMQTVGPDPTLLKHWIKNSPFPNKLTILGDMEQAKIDASQVNNDTNDSQSFASLPDSVKEEFAKRGIYSYKDLNTAREQEEQSQNPGPPGHNQEGNPSNGRPKKERYK